MKALKLTIIGFCGLENSSSDAISIHEEQIFLEDSHETAHFKLAQYLQGKEYKPYLGWDQEVYPKFKIETVWLTYKSSKIDDEG